MKVLSILLVLFFVVSCSSDPEEERLNECFLAGTDGSKNSFACPKQNPNINSLSISYNQNIELEAGSNDTVSIEITNNESFDIFGLNFNGASSNCPGIFKSGQTCQVDLSIQDNIAGFKEAQLRIRDITGGLNHSIPIPYEVYPTYPTGKDIRYTIEEVSFDVLRISINNLKDKFNNEINEVLNISSEKLLGFTNGNFTIDDIRLELQNGSGVFFVKTLSLDSLDVVDSGLITIELDRTYSQGDRISKNIPISFTNNKPILDNQVISISGFEDSAVFINNFPLGSDPFDQPLNYIISQKPSKGNLDCLLNEKIINLKTCRYIPAPNFNGIDTFQYKADNGFATSIGSVTYNINIQSNPDIPEIIPISTIVVKEDIVTNFKLPKLKNFDKIDYIYEVKNQGSKGNVSCQNDSCIYTPNLNATGSDSAEVSIKDNNIEVLSVNINFDITPQNDPPQFNSFNDISLNEDTSIVFNLPIATDVENDPISYNFINNPNNGKITNCNSLTCEYIPNKNFNGIDSFLYEAIDSNGSKSQPITVSFNITPINDPPYFVDNEKSYQVVQNSSFQLIINNAIDPESNPINYEIVTLPTGGTLTNCQQVGSPSLNCLYTNTSGLDDFIEYKAIDSLNEESELYKIKLLISPNSNPIINPNTISLNINEDTPSEISLLTGTDPDGDEISYRIKSAPTNGSLSSCMNLSDSINYLDNNCIYIPNDDFVGTDTFIYEARDSLGNISNEVTVVINVLNINDPPQFESQQINLEGNEDSEIDFVLPIATDVESDPITYSFNLDNLEGSINCINNDCVYIPPLNFNGQDSFTYISSDGNDTSELTYFITINPINDRPQLSNSSFVVNEDEQNQIILPNAIDIDSPDNHISYHLVSAPTKGILSNCLSIDDINGLECNYQPESNYFGVDSFTYRASDGVANSNIVTVSLTINNINDPPFFIEQTKQIETQENNLTNLSLFEAIDVDGDPISYELVTSPLLGNISNCFPSINNCNYTAFEKGNDEFIYIAKDDKNAISNSVVISLNVTEREFLYFQKIQAKYNGNVISLRWNNDGSSRNSWEINGNLFLNASLPVDNYNQNYLVRISNVGELMIIGQPVQNGLAITQGNNFYYVDNNSKKVIRINNLGEKDLEINYDNSVNLTSMLFFNNVLHLGSNRGSIFKMYEFDLGILDLSFLYEEYPRGVLPTDINSNINLLENDRNQNLIFSYNKGNINQIMIIDKFGEAYDDLENFNLDFINNIYTINNENNEFFLYAYMRNSSNENILFKLNLERLEENIAILENINFSIRQLSKFRFFNIQNEVIAISSSGDIYNVQDGIQNLNLGDSTNVIVNNNQLFHLQGNNLKIYENNLQNPIDEVGNVSEIKKNNENILYSQNSNLYVYGKGLIANGFAINLNFITNDLSHNIKFDDGTYFQIERLYFRLSKEYIPLVENFIYGFYNDNNLFNIIEQPNCTNIFIENIDSISMNNNNCVNEEYLLYNNNFKSYLKPVNSKPFINNDLRYFEKDISTVGEIQDYTIHQNDLYYIKDNNGQKDLYLYENPNSLILDNITGFTQLENKLLVFSDNNIYEIVNQSLNLLDINFTGNIIDVNYIDNSYFVLVENYNQSTATVLLEYNNGLENVFNINSSIIPKKIKEIIGEIYIIGLKGFDRKFLGTNSFVTDYTTDVNSEINVNSISLLDQRDGIDFNNANEFVFIINIEPQPGLFVRDIFRYFTTNSTLAGTSFFDATNADNKLVNSQTLGLDFTNTNLFFNEIELNNSSKVIVNQNRFSNSIDNQKINDKDYNELVRKINNEIYFISRSSDYSTVILKNVGLLKSVQTALTNQSNIINVPHFLDNEGNNLTYDIDFSNGGDFTNCLGRDGSNIDDLACNYQNDNSGLEIVTIRAFDGIEFSNEYILNIINY